MKKLFASLFIALLSVAIVSPSIAAPKKRTQITKQTFKSLAVAAFESCMEGEDQNNKMIVEYCACMAITAAQNTVRCVEAKKLQYEDQILPTCRSVIFPNDAQVEVCIDAAKAQEG